MPTISGILSKFSRLEIWAAKLSMPFGEEIGLGLGATLTLIGVFLHWRLPSQRMNAEEEVKDGKMTEDQANRRLKVLSVCAPIATLGGVALMLTVVAQYME
jgi:hypothetical protein